MPLEDIDECLRWMKEGRAVRIRWPSGCTLWTRFDNETGRPVARAENVFFGDASFPLRGRHRRTSSKIKVPFRLCSKISSLPIPSNDANVAALKPRHHSPSALRKPAVNSTSIAWSARYRNSLFSMSHSPSKGQSAGNGFPCPSSGIMTSASLNEIRDSNHTLAGQGSLSSGRLWGTNINKGRKRRSPDRDRDLKV